MVPDGWGQYLVGRFSNNACNNVMYVVVIVMICFSESRGKSNENQIREEKSEFVYIKMYGNE